MIRLIGRYSDYPIAYLIPAVVHHNHPILLGLGWCRHFACGEMQQYGPRRRGCAPATPPCSVLQDAKLASYGTDRGPSPQSPYAENGPLLDSPP